MKFREDFVEIDSGQRCSGWPLHYAAAIGDCDTIRRLCLREGLDPNLKMTSWCAALCFVLAFGFDKAENEPSEV